MYKYFERKVRSSLYIAPLIKYSIFSFTHKDKKITNSRAMVYTNPGITNNIY